MFGLLKISVMRSKSDGSCVRSVRRERYVGGSVMGDRGVNCGLFGSGSEASSASEVCGIFGMRGGSFDLVTRAAKFVWVFIWLDIPSHHHLMVRSIER